jgi:hypothetical protein
MLKIKIKSANSINGLVGSFDQEIMLNKNYIWIGRGE